MIKKIILVASLLTALSFSPASAQNSMPLSGIPQYAPSVLSVSLNAEARKSLAKTVTALSGLREFSAAKILYEKSIGVPMPIELLGYAGVLEGFDIATFITDTSKRPSVLTIFKFIDEKSAASFIASIKSAIQKTAVESKNPVVITEKKESGFRIFSQEAGKGASYDPFLKEKPMFFTNGKTVVMYLFQNSDATNSARYLADCLACIKSGKGSFLSNPNLAAIQKTAGNYQIIFYMDGALIKDGAIKAGSKEMSEAVNYLLYLATINENFTRISGLLRISLNKDPKLETSSTGFIKKLISAQPSKINPFALAPKGTSALAYFNINLDADFINSPLISGIKFLTGLLGISADNDVFPWLSAPLFAFICEDGGMLTGAGASDPKKAEAAVEKIAATAKSDFEIADESTDSIKFKNFIKKDGVSFSAGTFSNAFIAAIGQDAFLKSAAAAKDTGSSLMAAAKFTSIMKYDPTSFFGFFADCEGYNLALTEIRKKLPGFSTRKFPFSILSMAVSAALKDGDIVAAIVLNIRADNFIEDLKQGLSSANLIENIFNNIPLKK